VRAVVHGLVGSMIPRSRVKRIRRRLGDIPDGALGDSNASESSDGGLEGSVKSASGEETPKDAVADIENPQYHSTYRPEQPGFAHVGGPYELIKKLEQVGYECLEYLAFQMALLLNTPSGRIRAILLEGPSGCGKSFLAKSLALISGAKLMTLSCYKGMNTQSLIEAPSEFALANAMAGRMAEGHGLMNLGILSKIIFWGLTSYSQSKPML